MPELPEVETVKRGLSKLIIGKKIEAVEYDWPKSFPNAKQDVDAFVIGSSVQDIRRRAKVLLIDLDSNYTLVVHLKMTGQLVYVDNTNRWGAGHPNDSLINDLPDKSTRVTFTFRDAHLYFNDQRKFGWIRLVPTPEVANINFFKKVGPEPLNSTFTVKEFMTRLKRRKNTSIKAALLDQTVIAGIGNIYADEALYAAKIHPATKVADVSEAKLRKLLPEIRNILNLSIKQGGSSDRNYVNAEGKKGSYLKFAKVFRREGKGCERCGSTVVKIRVAGRGTHICPKCQKVRV